MNIQNKKCVMIIDENLPLGIIANTAAILGITLGKKLPEVVGQDVWDGSGQAHLGIIEFPVPVLQSSVKEIWEIRETLYTEDFQDILTVDFSDLAQHCKTYYEFVKKMEKTCETQLRYIGLALCGEKKKVNALTGRMSLLR